MVQIENVNKEVEIVKKTNKQKKKQKFWSLKSPLTETKNNLLEGLRNKFDKAKGRSSKPEHKPVEIIMVL